MTELLITDITRMRQGLCVIGLERHKVGFSSIRPIPINARNWSSFPYQRGNRIAFELENIHVTRPHLEDRVVKSHRMIGSLSETEVLDCLRQAEIATTVTGLFGCNVSCGQGGGNVHVNPTEANRSICGCEVVSARFRFTYFPPNIRVAIGLESGDTLMSLPLVDHEWRRLAERVLERHQGAANLQHRLQRFFDSKITEELSADSAAFARIGLARPDQNGMCWLMLDSLFPLPRERWLEEFD